LQRPRCAGAIQEAGQVTDVGENFAEIFGAVVQGAVQPYTIEPENLRFWITYLADNTPEQLTEVVHTYYDVAMSNPDLEDFFTTQVQENLRLRVAATTYEFVYDGLDDTYDHATHYSYDIHGNVKEMVQDQPFLGTEGTFSACLDCPDHRYKHLRYDYDLISGNVKQVNYQAGQPDQFHHRYRYDADNRIEEVHTSRNGITWRTDARYFYYPHGPLQRVEIGDEKVQGVDYAYTLQGWLKGINSTLLMPENDMGRDAAHEVLDNPNALIGRDVYGLRTCLQ
jgi:hypothetical protein